MEEEKLVPYVDPSDITYHGEGIYSQKPVLRLKPEPRRQQMETGAITIKVNAEPSEELKQMMRSILTQILQEPEVLDALVTAVSKRQTTILKHSIGQRGA